MPLKGEATPQKLPFCPYPTAGDVKSHGLYPLPARLPLLDLNKVQPYRSARFKVVRTTNFTAAQFLKLTRMIARSFAINEPMTRHVWLPKDAPAGLSALKHRDALGEHAFGRWTKQNIMFWVFRLFIVTDPGSQPDKIIINQDAALLSLAIINTAGQIIGGAINITLATPGSGRPMRENDPFIDAAALFSGQIYQFVFTQLELSLHVLFGKYPDFARALNDGKVADLNLIARSPSLPTEDTFELVAASAGLFQQMGHRYMIISAANQWTGAACEVLGGQRVHFAAYRSTKIFPESAVPLQGMASSVDGFISAKDSGCMLYVFRLK